MSLQVFYVITGALCQFTIEIHVFYDFRVVLECLSRPMEVHMDAPSSGSIHILRLFISSTVSPPWLPAPRLSQQSTMSPVLIPLAAYGIQVLMKLVCCN